MIFSATSSIVGLGDFSGGWVDVEDWGLCTCAEGSGGCSWGSGGWGLGFCTGGSGGGGLCTCAEGSGGCSWGSGGWGLGFCTGGSGGGGLCTCGGKFGKGLDISLDEVPGNPSVASFFVGLSLSARYSLNFDRDLLLFDRSSSFISESSELDDWILFLESMVCLSVARFSDIQWMRTLQHTPGKILP